MSAFQPIMSPERMEQARRYRAVRYRLLLLSVGVSGLYLAALVLGGGKALWELVPNTFAFVAALLALHFLVGLPLDYWGYRQAKQFGLTVQSTGNWLSDQVKSFVLGLLTNGALAWLVLWLWLAKPSTWYMWGAAVAVAGDLLLTFVAPVLIMPLFHRYSPLPEGDLRDRLLHLSAEAGVFVRGVFVSEVSTKSTTLNAALTGIGSTRRIILYDTMIEACTPDEVEVVLGHELGHHVYGHILKMTLFSSLLLVGLFLVAGFAVAPISTALGLGGLQPAALPLMALLFALIGLPLLPVFMAVSRQWERDCDRFALERTRKPCAFISAFRKLADRNLADFTPPRWVYWFLYSHPPVPERIAMAERYAAGGLH